MEETVVSGIEAKEGVGEKREMSFSLFRSKLRTEGS